MKFREEFADYASYQEDEYYFSSIPMGMLGPLQGYILRYCEDVAHLKRLCHYMATLIPCETTTHWGWDFLVSEFDDLLHTLAKGKFHKFMDFIQQFVETDVRSNEALEDINDIFAAFNFGYEITYGRMDGARWSVRSTPVQTSKTIDEAIAVVVDDCQQAWQHLLQAKEHLKANDNERALKDALRDSLSTMESIVKYVTGESKFDAACQSIQRDPRYGNKEVSREPTRLWGWIHELYPDVRHGQATLTEISFEEATFWIDRIIAISNFLVRTHKKK